MSQPAGGPIASSRGMQSQTTPSRRSFLYNRRQDLSPRCVVWRAVANLFGRFLKLFFYKCVGENEMAVLVRNGQAVPGVAIGPCAVAPYNPFTEHCVLLEMNLKHGTFVQAKPMLTLDKLQANVTVKQCGFIVDPIKAVNAMLTVTPESGRCFVSCIQETIAEYTLTALLDQPEAVESTLSNRLQNILQSDGYRLKKVTMEVHVGDQTERLISAPTVSRYNNKATLTLINTRWHVANIMADALATKGHHNLTTTTT